MKKLLVVLAAILPVMLLVAYSKHSGNTANGFITGTPAIKSINSLAFGEKGVLFIGDSKSASVFAIDTKDVEPLEKAAPVEIKNIDQKIAAFLGTEAKNILITDLKVNPISKKIYCSVQAADGTPVLLKVDNANIQAVSLKEISYSNIELNGAPAEDAKDKRDRPLRVASIADLKYAGGKVMVSGISGAEFSSTFRSIPFPFGKLQEQTSLKIYHVDHGRYETESPIQTFTTASLNGKEFLIASYTCTPLVLFPVSDLKTGTQITGRTVGEFGAGNRPLDMITMQKNGESFLIMSNSDRPVMKVKYKDIESFQGSLTAPIKEIFSTEGVPYVSFPMVNVTQLDKLDDTQFVYIQRKSNGDLNLQTQNNRAL